MGTASPTPSRGKKLTVSFGLVNVGVKYAPLVQEHRTKGHLVDPDTLGPVKQQYVNEAGKVVKQVSAYDHPSGPVVLADRGALESERDGRLELKAFAWLNDVDPLYFESTYLVFPDKGHEAGYDLLCGVLADSQRVLIGTAVLTKSTKAVVLRYAHGCLLAHACTYDANIAWGDHKLVTMGREERPVADQATLDMAMSLFESLPSTFDFAAVTDEYDARLVAAIEATAEGRPIPESDQLKPAEVLDLMDALKASVEAAKEKAKPKKATTPRGKKTKAAA
jgi:DNA end-binding protein Ku